MRAASLVAALALSACAPPGVVEVEIGLPERPVGDAMAWHPHLSVGRDRAPTDDAEVVIGGNLIDSRTEICASVFADQSLEALVARVRFCRSSSPGGCAPGEPEVRVRAERPGYAGRRTYVRFDVPEFPTDDGPTVEIGRCEVWGCAPDQSVTGFCVEGDGAHLCELDVSVEVSPQRCP